MSTTNRHTNRHTNTLTTATGSSSNNNVNTMKPRYFVEKMPMGASQVQLSGKFCVMELILTNCYKAADRLAGLDWTGLNEMIKRLVEVSNV